MKSHKGASLGERKSGQFVFTKLASLVRRGKLAESRGADLSRRVWADVKPSRHKRPAFRQWFAGGVAICSGQSGMASWMSSRFRSSAMR